MIKFLMNIKNIKWLYNLLLFLGFILWFSIVKKNAPLYSFNSDELWAWDIAHDLNFSQIVQLMHYEGHSFLWYMIIKPFTFLADTYPSLFPYALKWINLAFMCIAMFLLWMFAPFNIFLKLLISYTSAFGVVYPALGRPYGFVILLLFIVAMLYNNRLKHPLIYSVLLLVLSQTCFNGLVGTIIFGGFFLYDLYKENKENLFSHKFLMPLFIICSGFIMLAIEWIPVYPPTYIKYFGVVDMFREFFFPEYDFQIYGIISLIIYCPLMETLALILYSNLKDRKLFFMILFILNIFVIFYLTIAPGRCYHLFMFYVYILVVYWMMLKSSQEFIEKKIVNISTTVFVTLLSMLYFLYFRDPNFWFIDDVDYKETAETIVQTIPEKSRVYLVLDYCAYLVPFLKDKYDLRTHYGDKIPSLDAYKGIYQNMYLFPQDMYPVKDKDTYYIVSKDYLDSFSIHKPFKTKNCSNLRDIYVLCKIEPRDNSENKEIE